MKRILIISPFNIFPPYWGGASRIYNIVKYLSRDNEVLLLCNEYNQIKYDNYSESDEFREISSNPHVKICFVKSLYRMSQIFNLALIIKAIKIVSRQKPDLIIAEFVWSGLTAIVLHLLFRIPYYLDEHNIEFNRFERMDRGTKLGRFMLKCYEDLVCNFASGVFCVSDVDKNILISQINLNQNKLSIVPNGVDTIKFSPNPRRGFDTRKLLGIDDEPLILFFGKLDYAPNYESIKVIYNDIAPKILNEIPDAKFLIVGENPPHEYSNKSFLFTGVVKKIEDYINASDVIICPLLSGGGTRIKILESLACGKCVVSTSIGAEGIIGEEIDTDIIISDNWSKFSEEVVALLLTERTSKKRKEFVKKYSWEYIILDLEKSFRRV